MKYIKQSLKRIDQAVKFIALARFVPFAGSTERRKIAGVAAIIAAFSLPFFSCTNNPTPVGSSLYPPQNKLTLHALDSFNPADSVTITDTTILQRLNNVNTPDVLTGLYRSYQARDLLKFAIVIDSSFTFDSIPHMNLKSAYLQLHLAGYRLGDTGATMRFNCTVNQILTPYDTGATWDSLGALTNYSSTPVGTFNGAIGQDDSLLDIPLDTGFVMGLLRYGSSDSLDAHLQGLAVLPQSGTTGITSFKTTQASIHLTFQLDTLLDTPVVNAVQNLSIVYGAEPNPPGEMAMQSGLVQRLHLYVNFPTVPQLATINAASLQLTLDTANSMFGKNHFYDSVGTTMRDTLFLFIATGDTAIGGVYQLTGARIPGTNVFSFPQIASFLALIRHGGIMNFGFVPLQGLGSTHGAGDEFATLDKFVFYSTAAQDSTLRPRVKLFYSVQSQ